VNRAEGVFAMNRHAFLAALAFVIAGTAPSFAMTGYSPADDRRADIELRVGADLLAHGREADAIPHLNAALDQSPDDVAILSDLGFAHRMVARASTGTARDAEMRLSAAYYHRVLEQDLNQRNFLAYMGELYLSRDDVKSARDELKALDAECPEGCVEHDHLAASIAAYTPPAPVTVSTP
jgi:Flp pilus assembly protein TadD